MTIKRLLGSAPSQVSRNRDLGTMAFQNKESVQIGNIGAAADVVTLGNGQVTKDASGNVGIGTSSPQYKFVVSNAGVEGFEVAPNVISGAVYSLFINRSTSTWIDDIRRASTYQWRDGPGNERMRLDSSGNLGLGVTPSAWSTSAGRTALQIGGNTAGYLIGNNGLLSGTNFYYNNSGNNIYISSAFATLYQQYQGVHSWFTAPSGTAGNAITFTQAMTLDASGNLGIGTSTPGANLMVYESINTDPVIAQFCNPNAGTLAETTVYITNSTTTSDGLFLTTTGTGYSPVGGYLADSCVIGSGTGASGGLALMTRSASDMRFYTNGHTNERMRIDSSGNLLVGTTISPDSVATGVGMGGGQIQTSRNSINPNIMMYKTSGFAGEMIRFNYTSTDVGSIDVTTTATSYNTSSDYRLKENIQPMQNALDVVAQLNPVTYTWKADGSDGQGFIAHELQAVVPDCVTGEKDAVDEDGNPVYQGIDTSFLVATLTKAIQELKAELDATKAEVAVLKGV